MSPAVQRVLEALELARCKPRRSGGQWAALCPAHGDTDPSLSIGEGKKGAVLRCFAGCATESIVEALGFPSQRALFADDGEPLTDRPAPPPPATKSRPPRGAVLDLWNRCRPVHQAPEVSGWLTLRGLDPLMVADRDLARALPPDGALPRWAWMGGMDWAQGRYLCVLPMIGSTGEIESLHVRNVRIDARKKGLFPAGCSMGGLVLADDAGSMMLRSGLLAGDLWIVEGAPDFLSTATAWGDAADAAPAVIGVVSGSWTAEIARRVPDQARVIVAVHHDEAGKKYLELITSSLASRVQLERWLPKGVAA